MTEGGGTWREGASWRSEAPVPPSEMKRRERKRRVRRSGGAGSIVGFFTKQALWFVILAMAMLLVDLFLYMVIAMHEMDRNYLYGTPATVTRTTSEQLAAKDGSYELGAEAASLLDEQHAWAQLVAPDGSVAWSRNVPAAGDGSGAVGVSDASDPNWGTVPERYTLSQVALVAHYHMVNGYPTFIWERDDGLLMVGFPAGSYETMSITWPKEIWASLPAYVGGILLFDLVILFAAYLVYRRRTQRAVEPINDALGVLARGGRVELDLHGDLQPIADHINETSDILERKDSAREQWIRGVSHDIRTPLSMIIGKADALASGEGVPDAVRAEAAAIRLQGMKIKDLVADLNAASQLSFGAHPLDLKRVQLPKLLRNVAASYLNGGFDEGHPLEFSLDERCADAVVLGDERMLVRMVENLLANARLHNPAGCTIRFELAPADGGRGGGAAKAAGNAGFAAAEGAGKAGEAEAAAFAASAAGAGASGATPVAPHVPLATILVADDGVGADKAALAALEERLARARRDPDGAVPDDAGHGLGLVLVDRIARAHGGALSIRSQEGAGFAATVTLPLA